MCAAARRRFQRVRGRQPLQPEATRECAGRNARKRRASPVWGRPNRSRPCLDRARNCIWRNNFSGVHSIERCCGRFAQHSLKFRTPERTCSLLGSQCACLRVPAPRAHALSAWHPLRPARNCYQPTVIGFSAQPADATHLEQSSVEAIGFRTAMCVRYSWMDHVGFNVAGAPAARLAKNKLLLARALNSQRESHLAMDENGPVLQTPHRVGAHLRVTS
jgi:hypothetical protein